MKRILQHRACTLKRINVRAFSSGQRGPSVEELIQQRKSLRNELEGEQVSFRNAAASAPTIIALNQKRDGRQKERSKAEFSLKSTSLLVVPAVALGLGVWQVYRLRWKLDIVKHLQDQLEAPAVPFPVERVSEDPNLDDLEYRRVRIKGRFLYDRQFAIGPCTRYDKAYKQVPKGIISDNDTTSHGAHIITPFLLHGTDKIIMVNRGWVPRDDIHLELEKKKRRSVTVELEAVVRKSEKRPQFVGENIPERGVWHYKDFDQMAQKCGALAVYMEAVYETTEPGGPIGGQTNVHIRNEHLNYALTWYAEELG